MSREPLSARERLSVGFRERREAVPTRSGRKFTQDQLAAKLGVSQPTVSNWETGAALPEPKMLAPLAQALNWDIRELNDLYAEAQSEIIETQGELIDAQQEFRVSRGVSRATEAMERFVDQYEDLGHTYRRLDEMAETMLVILKQMSSQQTEMLRLLRGIAGR